MPQATFLRNNWGCCTSAPAMAAACFSDALGPRATSCSIPTSPGRPPDSLGQQRWTWCSAGRRPLLLCRPRAKGPLPVLPVIPSGAIFLLGCCPALSWEGTCIHTAGHSCLSGFCWCLGALRQVSRRSCPALGGRGRVSSLIAALWDGSSPKRICVRLTSGFVSGHHIWSFRAVLQMESHVV